MVSEYGALNSFNIRVYGLLLNDTPTVLVTDEYRFGMEMTKFPGGGLQFGEGSMDCLKRECLEELGQEIEVVRHFYTTDYFQRSEFHKDQQLLSIYYLIRTAGPVQFIVSSAPFDFEREEGAQSFRWVALEELKEDELTFPVDRKVACMLKNECLS